MHKTTGASGAIPASRSEDRLNELLAAAGLDHLQVEQNKTLIYYLALILRWNARTNLTAVRDEEGILSRHFVESIAGAQALPAGIATLLDFGSGAGFPGIPIAICRPEIAVTLVESHGKKAAFLQEAARVLQCSTWNNPIRVHSGRAETLTGQFGCVTLRAVDRMEQAIRAAARLVKPGGWLALMTTIADLPVLQSAAGQLYAWSDSIRLPGAESRILALGRRSALPFRLTLATTHNVPRGTLVTSINSRPHVPPGTFIADPTQRHRPSRSPTFHVEHRDPAHAAPSHIQGPVFHVEHLSAAGIPHCSTWNNQPAGLTSVPRGTLRIHCVRPALRNSEKRPGLNRVREQDPALHAMFHVEQSLLVFF